MTKNEINAAIAESLGWKYHAPPVGGASVNPWQRPSGGYVEKPPNYVTDLNAINHVVRSKWNILSSWAMEMRRIVSRDDVDKEIDGERLSDLWFYCATAKQRCEGYLRSIGKWRDA